MTQHITMPELAARLAMVLSDHSRTNSLLEQCPALVAFVADAAKARTVADVENTHRLPPIAEMTAIQTALYDNWPTGRRKHGFPNRYGLCLEVWTAGVDRRPKRTPIAMPVTD